MQGTYVSTNNNINETVWLKHKDLEDLYIWEGKNKDHEAQFGRWNINGWKDESQQGKY